MHRARAARRPALHVEAMEPREAPSCCRIAPALPAGSRHGPRPRPALVVRIGRVAGVGPASPSGNLAAAARSLLRCLATGTSQAQQVYASLQGSDAGPSASQVQQVLGVVGTVATVAGMLAQQSGGDLGNLGGSGNVSPQLAGSILSQIALLENAVQLLLTVEGGDQFGPAAQMTSAVTALT